MQLLRAPRVLMAVACVAAGLAGGLVAAERSSASMAAAATSFLGSLSPEQRQKATFAFESDERTHWHFIPTDAFPRKGLTLKEMNEAPAGAGPRTAEGGLEPARLPDGHADHGSRERSSGRSSSATGPSGSGAENMVRDPERYFVSVFGTPSTRPPGAGASRVITCRCSSRSSTARWSPTRRSSSDRTRPRCARGRRRVSGSSRRAKTRPAPS